MVKSTTSLTFDADKAAKDVGLTVADPRTGPGSDFKWFAVEYNWGWDSGSPIAGKVEGRRRYGGLRLLLLGFEKETSLDTEFLHMTQFFQTD